MRLRDSVRGKLLSLVLLTTAIALLVDGAAMLTHDLLSYRQTWASELMTEAQILARSTAPALAFDDREVAQRNLLALQARPAVREAALYNSEGRLYAQYTRAGEPAAPARWAGAEGVRILGGRVEVSHAIVQNGEHLGTIYLRADYDVAGRVRAYLGIFALVTLLSMGVALALSSTLRRVITLPLDAIASVARQTIERRDYSLRALKSTDDEIGVVVDAFNAMLDEVQARTRALESSNAALHSEMRVRESTEQALRASERLYRAIGESMQYGVWVCDALGRNTYCSESYLRLLGLTHEQYAGFGGFDSLEPQEGRTALAQWLDCVRTGSPWYREMRVRGADGASHWILSQGVAIHDESGAISGWAGIHLDIGRLKRTEEALREADRRKDEFLATLAHELRNPLAPIRHAVHILDAPEAGERQRQWGREVIARQVQRMALLLDDLLDVSRITRGRLELKKDYVSLSALVGSAVETARPLIETKRHTLELHLPHEPLELEADPLRLSQALSNLLTNAAKYTDPGGRIVLSASLESGQLVITVKDNGIGLAPAALPRLFEMFSQIDSAIDRAEGGLGIGLALVRGLIALHGGEVEARSEGLGRGSTFIIRLPSSIIVSARAKQEEPYGEARPLRAPGSRIVIADDNRDAAETLAAVLRLSAYEVHVAHSGPEALELAARVRPEALILDIGMPGMTGYEVARRVRAEAWGRRALLLALTGWGQSEDKERARAAGFDRHLTKPVDPRDVERLLAEHEQRTAGAQHASDEPRAL